MRLQVLTPIPRGDSLHELSEQMQGEVDRLAPQRVWERFASEEPALAPCLARGTAGAGLVSRSALVRVEGAWYSVPDGHGLGRGGGDAQPRDGAGEPSPQRFGGRRVSYRHYLGELSRKPQALRQVAPELLAELGEPYGRLWALLEGERGGHEAARTLAAAAAGAGGARRGARARGDERHASATAAASMSWPSGARWPGSGSTAGGGARGAAGYAWSTPRRVTTTASSRVVRVSEAARAAVLEAHCRELKLPTIRRLYPELVRQATQDGWDYEEFLLQLIEVEVLTRRDGAVARLLRQARFPDLKTFEQLDWEGCGASSARSSPSSRPARASSAPRTS